MATKARDTSHGKEKVGSHIDPSHGRSPRTPKSSFPTSPDKANGAASEKPIPNYLKHTLSSSKEPVCKLQTHGKKPVPSESSPRFSRRKSFDKPPSPAKLQRTLSSNSSRERTPIKPQSPSPKSSISPSSISSPRPSISPKSVSAHSSKPVSERISISPKTASDRTLKTAPRNIKTVQPVSTKPKILRRTSSNTSSKNEIKASPSPSIASSTTPTSPETIETPSAFEVEQEDKVILEQVAHEKEVLKVEEEEEIPFEIPPDNDQVLVDHVNDESQENLDVEIPKTPEDQTPLEEKEQEELVTPTPQIEETQETTIESVENQNQQEDEDEQVIIINEDNKDMEEVLAKQHESNTVSESQDKTETEAGDEVESETKTTVKPIIREEKTNSMGESSEENKPYKMKFQQAKELEVQVENEGPQKLKFKEREVAKDDVKGKKEYNDVIEETASKLLEKRKSKVLALAGAFETVISLQEPEGQ